MPGLTPINGLPIPLLGDTSADITDAVSDYATAADSLLVPRFASVAARDAAITAPVAGQLAAVTATDELYVYRNSVWQGAAYRGVTKITETQVVNNSTTTVNDDTLFIPIEANSVYVFKMVIAYLSTTVADFKYQLTGPAGMSGTTNVIYLDPSTGGYSTIGTLTPATDRQVSGASPSSTQTEENGILTTTGTAGNFQIKWAQRTAEATNTTLKMGSFIQLLKIG